MTRIRIISIGKDKDIWLTQGLAHYETLLKRWATVDWLLLPHPKQLSADTPDAVKRAEAVKLLEAVGDAKFIALTIQGKEHDSLAFSRQLIAWQEQFAGRLTFVIGGAYGLDASIAAKTTHHLSLSALTFSHQITRLVLLEQLFRGFSIANNTGYHK